MPDDCEPTGLAGHLLHHIDPDAGLMLFVPTTRDRLAGASFVDGRTPIATGAPRAVPLAAALGPTIAAPDQPRYILHMGFCGSTLLARLLDVPGVALVLKEPNALADLANWRAHGAARGAPDSRLPAVTHFAAAALHRRWAPDEAVVVKPSNWANNLVDLLAPHARVVVVTIAARAFVTAVFRGGRDRMVFASRALLHLSHGVPEYERLFADATAGGGPFERVARIAALLHAVQADRLAGIAAATIDFTEVRDSPETAVAAAAAALALPPPGDALRTHRAALIAADAKAPGLDYSRDAHSRADAAVLVEHGGAIDAAIDWVAARLPLRPRVDARGADAA